MVRLCIPHPTQNKRNVEIDPRGHSLLTLSTTTNDGRRWSYKRGTLLLPRTPDSGVAALNAVVPKKAWIISNIPPKFRDTSVRNQPPGRKGVCARLSETVELSVTRHLLPRAILTGATPTMRLPCSSMFRAGETIADVRPSGNERVRKLLQTYGMEMCWYCIEARDYNSRIPL